MSDKRSYNQLDAIQRYFKVSIARVNTNDWDEVERAVQRVIKSSRAGANLRME